MAVARLQDFLQKINHQFGVELTNIVINCCETLAAYLASHKDQAFDLGSSSGKFETEASVFNYSLGADRGLCFIKDTGSVFRLHSSNDTHLPVRQ